MATSTIEWTEAVLNAFVGCSIISPGCHHCYAMILARRLKAMALAKIALGQDPGRLRYYIDVIGDDGRWNGKVVFVPEALEELKKWKKSQTIFVNSMSDMFHESLSVDAIRKLCIAMATSDHHVYQILTKRADRMAELLTGELREFASLPQIWWGTSVENKRHGLPRIDHLRRVPAALRFLSVEPLLEDLGPINLDDIHWVIVGGESGHGARPMQKAWVENIAAQCKEKDVPFFLKQWGGQGGGKGKNFNPDPTDPTLVKSHPNYAKGGCQLDGQIYHEMPGRVSLTTV